MNSASPIYLALVCRAAAADFIYGGRMMPRISQIGVLQIGAFLLLWNSGLIGVVIVVRGKLHLNLGCLGGTVSCSFRSLRCVHPCEPAAALD